MLNVRITILQNKCMTVRQIVKDTSISYSIKYCRLEEDCLQDGSQVIFADPLNVIQTENYLAKLVIMEESWVHYYDVENKMLAWKKIFIQTIV